MRRTQWMRLLFLLISATVISMCSCQVLPKEVVVVGGGIAGLSAARQIANRGRGNFTVHVFEARRERYGGRVWTNKLKNPKARGLEVDLGGCFLNTVSPFTNPLLNLTRDLELETATISNAQFVVPWLNKKYSDDELKQAFLQILIQAVNSTRQQNKDMSVREAVNRQLREKGLSPDSVQALLLQSLPSYVLQDYSALRYQADSLDFGYERVLLDGMSELVDRLVSGSEDEIPLKLSLRTAVRQIKVDRAEGKVTLRLKDGSQVTVDQVIVAVPAPVIARGDLLFEPGLPKEYQWAVSQIGMSAGNKIIVEFDFPFWTDDYGVFIQAPQTEDELGYLQTWLNIHKLLGIPVLTGLLLGDAATQVENLSDEEVQALVLKKLQSLFGKDSLSSHNIVKISRSSWTSDKLAGGASSYPRVDSIPKMWDTFAEPLCPSVYFAGEHTIFRGHGTLHGAYLSGVRAAEQVLSGYCAQETLAKEEERKKRRKKSEQQNRTDKGDSTKGKEAEDVKDEL